MPSSFFREVVLNAEPPITYQVAIRVLLEILGDGGQRLRREPDLVAVVEHRLGLVRLALQWNA